MIIDELLSYEFTCKISKEYKNHPDFSKNKFKIIFKESSKYECGYKAIITYLNNSNEEINDEWDGEIVAKKLMFDTWNIIDRNLK